jgi:hypothetical protein
MRKARILMTQLSCELPISKIRLRVDRLIKVDCLERSGLPPGGEEMMLKAHFRRLARLGTGALVLLIVHCVGSPRSAWAGCSHPPGASTVPFRDLYRLDTILMGEAPSSPFVGLSQFPPESPARRSPCSGMSCSSRDPLPVSTASPGARAAQQWCSLDALAVCHMINSWNCRALDEPVPAASGPKTSIFHPPRS